ncbi:MAG: CopG family transcriptional regulator [Microthrixaceae bacterium]
MRRSDPTVRRDRRRVAPGPVAEPWAYDITYGHGSLLTLPRPLGRSAHGAVCTSTLTIAEPIYGMSVKSTVYLPDDLKAAVEAEAKRRGCSEAALIRDSLRAAVRIAPEPARIGVFAAEPFAGHADELLAGFGER